MASRHEVEVIITSAKDLKNVNWRHGPNRPYAVVWVDPNVKCSTKVDEEGNTCPYWDETLVIPLPGPVGEDTTLFIDIVHAGDEEDTEKLIGSAQLKLLEVGVGHRVKRKLILQQRPSSGHHHQGEVYVEVVVIAPSYSHGGYPPFPPPVYQPQPQPPRKPSLLKWIATRLGVDVAVNFISGLLRECLGPLGGGDNEDHLGLLNDQF